jgi:hypothetical protein
LLCFGQIKGTKMAASRTETAIIDGCMSFKMILKGFIYKP